MILKTGHKFPDDFKPVFLKKTQYYIPYLGKDHLFVGEAPIYVERGHEIHKLLRLQLQYYDLRLPADRAEWTALLIQLIMSESDEIDIIEVSDKVAKLLKELNSSADIEKMMERLENLGKVKDDIQRRMGIEARIRNEAATNAQNLALKIAAGEGSTINGTPSKG